MDDAKDKLMEALASLINADGGLPGFKVAQCSMLGGDNNWRLVFWVQLGDDIIRTYVVHQRDFVEIFPDPILLASNNVKG